MRAIERGCLAGVLAVGLCGSALAQVSKSAPLAKQLVSALTAAKLDSVAAKDPMNADGYFAVLNIPGVQLLVISAQYPVPALLDPRVAKGEYRDVYVELNSAGVAASKVFFEDLGANGIYAKSSDDNPMDIYEAAGKRIVFNGDWGEQKLSEQEYMKTFAAADQRYAEILTALLGQLKPTS